MFTDRVRVRFGSLARSRALVAKVSRWPVLIVSVVLLSSVVAIRADGLGTNSNMGNWYAAASSPYAFAEGASALVGSKMYVLGGYQNGNWDKPATGAAVMDLRTNKWSRIASLPRGLTHAGRAVDRNTIYLVGGVAAQGSGEVFATDQVWAYDTIANKWYAAPRLPAPRGSGGAVVVGHKLHFFGGVDGNRVPKSDHWTLDLDNKSKGWQWSPPWPGGLSHFAVVQYGSALYTFGGQTGWDSWAVASSAVWRYDLMSQKWTKLASMPKALSHIEETAVVSGNKLWVVGGQVKPPAGTRDVYTFDFAYGGWTKTTAQLPGWRFAAVAVAYNSVIYHAGGDLSSKAVWKAAVY